MQDLLFLSSIGIFVVSSADLRRMSGNSRQCICRGKKQEMRVWCIPSRLRAISMGFTFGGAAARRTTWAFFLRVRFAGRVIDIAAQHVVVILVHVIQIGDWKCRKTQFQINCQWQQHSFHRCKDASVPAKSRLRELDTHTKTQWNRKRREQPINCLSYYGLNDSMHSKLWINYTCSGAVGMTSV